MADQHRTSSAREAIQEVAAARRAIRRHDRLAEVVEIMGGTILARDWDVVLAELRVRLDLLDDLLGPGNGYR